jgi:hypothetical protein
LYGEEDFAERTDRGMPGCDAFDRRSHPIRRSGDYRADCRNVERGIADLRAMPHGEIILANAERSLRELLELLAQPGMVTDEAA